MCLECPYGNCSVSFAPAWRSIEARGYTGNSRVMDDGGLRGHLYL